MKTIFLLAALSLLKVSFSQSVFQLNGQFIEKSQNTKRVVLRYLDANKQIKLDTTEVKGGTFTFHGFISGPTIASLRGNTKSSSVDDPNFVELFLEPALMEIRLEDGNFKSAVITGSKTQTDKLRLDAMLKTVTAECDSLHKALMRLNAIESNADSHSLDANRTQIKDELDKKNQERRNIELDFVRSNPESAVSAEVMLYLANYLNFREVKSINESLDKKVKESAPGFQFGNLVRRMENTQVGYKAANFVLKTLNHDSVSLRSLLGNGLVLLEFWASWCKPCREGFPALKSLQQRVGAKALNIVAITRDMRKGDWVKAVEMDGIQHWINGSVFDNYVPNASGRLMLNDIENEYYIPAIPLSVLIDSNGYILGVFSGKTMENERQLEMLVNRYVAEANQSE